jgi:hypothetical protein
MAGSLADPEAWQKGADTYYYAINPRNVGGLVEKSWKIALCEIKCQ